MCEKCEQKRKELSGTAKRVQETQDRIGDFINQDAEKLYNAGKPEHPYVHAEALVDTATGLIALPLKDLLEENDEEIVDDLLGKAHIFKESVLQSLSIAGQTHDIPTISGILGLLEASKELLETYHDEIETMMSGDGATPSEETKASAQELQDILKGILSNNE